METFSQNDHKQKVKHIQHGIKFIFHIFSFSIFFDERTDGRTYRKIDETRMITFSFVFPLPAAQLPTFGATLGQLFVSPDISFDYEFFKIKEYYEGTTPQST